MAQEQRNPPTEPLPVEEKHEDADEDVEESSDEKKGRRKIEISFIENKSRRHITFSKRKAGIMKKAYELATLTGTQVLLLVASETGHVYTFATPKLQPLITNPEGKNLIQACLNAPDQSAQAATPEKLPAPQQASYISPDIQQQKHYAQAPQAVPMPYPEAKRPKAEGAPRLPELSYPTAMPTPMPYMPYGQAPAGYPPQAAPGQYPYPRQQGAPQHSIPHQYYAQQAMQQQPGFATPQQQQQMRSHEDH